MKDLNNPINNHVKIHLAKEKDSLMPACKTKIPFFGLVVANNFEKVSCKHCLTIVESIKRSLKN